MVQVCLHKEYSGLGSSCRDMCTCCTKQTSQHGEFRERWDFKGFKVHDILYLLLWNSEEDGVECVQSCGAVLRSLRHTMNTRLPAVNNSHL